jgi:hypothetical protein
MTIQHIVPTMQLIMCVCACAVYLYCQDYRRALYWFGAAIVTAAVTY